MSRICAANKNRRAGSPSTALPPKLRPAMRPPPKNCMHTNFEAALSPASAPTDSQGLAAPYSANTAVKTLIDSFNLTNNLPRQQKPLVQSGQ